MSGCSLVVILICNVKSTRPQALEDRNKTSCQRIWRMAASHVVPLLPFLLTLNNTNTWYLCHATSKDRKIRDYAADMLHATYYCAWLITNKCRKWTRCCRKNDVRTECSVSLRTLQQRLPMLFTAEPPKQNCPFRCMISTPMHGSLGPPE